MEANIEIAQLLFRQNKYQETIDACNQILTTDNNSIEAIKLIAKSFLATRKIDDARLYLNKAVKIKPNDYESIKDLGNSYQAVGDINNAKKYYQKAIEVNPVYGPALTNLGSIELNTGNKQEALSLLIKATESNPQLAPAWVNLANGYIQFGKTQEAENACRKSIELNPHLFNSYFLLGTILLAQKKIQEAEQPLRKTIELKPDLFQAHLNLGAILKDLGNLEEAEVFTLKAIELNPDYAIAYSNLGNILRDLGRLQEAQVSARKAIEINPKLTCALINLGMILGTLGKTGESILSLNKALKLEPTNLKTYGNISFILRDYIWFTKNLSYELDSNIEELIKLEKKKLNLKLSKVPLWFIDIPRTSSTTTQFHMWNTFGWPFGKKTIISNGKIIHERSLLMPNHTPAIIAKYLIGEKVWDSINSFTIVRNPYKWCVSLWQSELKDVPRFRYQCLSFLQFLHLLEDNLKSEPKERKIHHNQLRQSDYILDEEGKILVKKILKFEEKETIKSFFEDNNITFKEPAHINKTKNNHHLISPSERKIIERIFAKDFEILRY